MQDRLFLEQFEDCSLPKEEFSHRNHVRAAWLFLRRDPLLIAMKKFTEALKRFATANGAAHIYHETITWAYLLLIYERNMESNNVETFEQFEEMNPDLFNREKPILKSYYREETLSSDLAKKQFVLPDKLN